MELVSFILSPERDCIDECDPLHMFNLLFSNMLSNLIFDSEVRAYWLKHHLLMLFGTETVNCINKSPARLLKKLPMWAIYGIKKKSLLTPVIYYMKLINICMRGRMSPVVIRWLSILWYGYLAPYAIGFNTWGILPQLRILWGNIIFISI